MRTWLAAALPAALGLAMAWAHTAPYDPLKLLEGSTVRTVDLTARDARRGRDIPLRVYMPEGKAEAPVVLFSHGLGGTRTGCAYLGEHWAKRGYASVFLQHPGSDDSVWRDTPARDRMAAMKRAASGRSFFLRVQDVSAALDQLAAWNKAEGHALSGRLDLARVGMSGHSFGAVTTQATSGQSFGAAGARLTDKRIKAAIAFSPSSPGRGDAASAFRSVRIPWMLMTGTRDTSIVNDTTVESRLAVFPGLPAGDKYEVVLHDAEHSAFSDRALPGDRVARNPNHHRAILALSTAFWDAYLRDDRAALRWLKGEGARSVLEPKDRWKTK